MFTQATGQPVLRRPQHQMALANKLLRSLTRLLHFQKLLLQQTAVNQVKFCLRPRLRRSRLKPPGNLRFPWRCQPVILKEGTIRLQGVE
ncbi:MAG: hypothetical protein DMG53_19595 [Acidobacteria bacterium]|nr:MAG: hypothetical protein DMG53_19595 [Acidobacteriota bacterium]